MRRIVSFLLLFLLQGPGLVTALAAKTEKEPADARPQLISTKGGGPKWKDTKELASFAAKSEPLACFELGARLLEGDAELPADPAKARALFEQAGQAGVADALFRLGKIYHDAIGVPRDYAKALEYYTAAARRGVPEAQHNIGAMLVSARGVKRDYIEGLAWLIVAKKFGGVSEAEAQVRARLAQKPGDIKLAEARATELSADLANAIVRGVMPAAPAGGPVRPLPPPAVTTGQLEKPAIAAPKIDPVAPPRITVPIDPLPPAPR